MGVEAGKRNERLNWSLE